jgi:DNA invertase Pin-like site-specific DNA recombinase
MLQMLGAFAELQRSMVREQTRLGLLAALERGASWRAITQAHSPSERQSYKNGEPR